MNRPSLALLILVAAILLAGCAPSPEGARPAAGEDVVAELPPVAGLPEYAYRSEMALKGYQIAVLEKELLARLPCYCGCGQDKQFQNLRDCFLNEQGEFNSHGANCEICQEEAKDAISWKQQGMTVKQIRDRIDNDYEGRGKPTDTPPVTE